MQDQQALLEIATHDHAHLCPRIILGVRIGMAGAVVLGLPCRPSGKHLFTIVENDGCFADGVERGHWVYGRPPYPPRGGLR